MVRFSLCLLLLVIPGDLLAQGFTPDPDWRFENFNSQNHFISRQISAITMDRHGYIWTCTEGLQRFDGYRTTNFTGNYAGVTVDNNGRVWVSSAGLCYYDDVSAKFIKVQADSNRKITSVMSLLVQDKYLWFVCEYGLAKLNLHSLKITFTSITNVTDPLGLYSTDENTLFISSREKVYTYNIKQNSYLAGTLIYNHALVKVFAVANRGRDVFLGTNFGLFALKYANDLALVSLWKKDIFISDMIFLPGDKEKRYLFLATEGQGLMAYDILLNKIAFTYTHDGNNPFSIPNNIISKMFIDKKGRLWLSTYLGISMLDLANQQLKMRFLSENTAALLGINKIARDKYDTTKVWMSSYNLGMMCVNWKTKEIERIFNKDPQTQNIYDFVQLSKSEWLLASQKKIMLWDWRSGAVSAKELPVPDSLRVLCNIRGLIMAGNSTCFITTNRGLFKYDLANRKITVASENKSKKQDNALAYILLKGFYDNGTLWIASRNGLFSYDTIKKTTTVYTGQGNKSDYFFFDIANAANNQVVCATGGGLLIFNKQTKRFETVKSIASLFNHACENVISINNTVWTSTLDGLLNYNISTRQAAFRADESSMVEVHPSSSFILIGNEIVFGFRNGYAYFTPALKIDSIPSDPEIEGVNVNNQPISQPYPPDKNGRKPVFNHSENSISIAFTAFLYTNPDYINFRYRLSGANSGWQYAGDQRSANYAQLEPGDYTFYVQGGNKNGEWNRHLASFSFIIQPPYWETWWFRMAMALAVAFALYRLYQYRIKHILAIERIRERIASDFHDDIGSALSSISIFSEVADKQLEEQLPSEKTREVISHITFHSRAMLDAMDDIIWAVNPQNDHFNDLAIRMREFAIPLLEARNIQFEFDINENILNTRIKMEARKNIFLIFKECINNMLKHSGCTSMKLSVGKSGNQLEFVINDNGKGFDVDALSSRNGLKNMRKRAQEINGKIVVTSQPGSGAITRLLVDII
jgi:signal transduction histidine kinase/ligand-binding sensor domain-containing protein